METRLSEQTEMMKRMMSDAAVTSIEELCFHFRMAVQTESVNVPPLFSFERHFRLLVEFAKDGRNVHTGLLHCLSSTNAAERSLPTVISTSRQPERLKNFCWKMRMTSRTI